MRKDWVETYLPNVCDILDNLRKPINSSERKKRIEGKSEGELYTYYGATGQVGYIDDYLTKGEFLLIGEDGAPFLDYTRAVAYKINGKTVEHNITEGLEKSEALRQSILKNAFGCKLLNKVEIEKCKQEVDYEPAVMLLERIKKEKKKK